MSLTHPDALDLTRSFVVEGAAGSGKSALALQRYLAALCAAKEPEEVLFLVDSDSAVAQIRQRIATALHGNASNGTPLASRDAESNWGLLEQPERLQIHTIGSLALALVAAAPVSSGCGAGARITTDPDAYYSTAARALLRTLDHDESVAPNLETLLLHLDNDLVRAERLVGGMLRRRAELQLCLNLQDPDGNRAALQMALEDAVVMTLSELSATMPEDVSAQLVATAAWAGKQLSRRGSDSPITAWRNLRSLPSTDAEHLTPWRGLCELLLEDDGSIRQEYGESQGFPAADATDDATERNNRIEWHSHISILASRLEEVPYFAARLRAVRDLPDVRYTHLQWTVLQSLLAVLPGVMDNLFRAFRALGEMDLTEIVQGATRALEAGQAEVFSARGLQHLVVDNAHELSFAAMRLIERLTHSWTGDDGRSLYITGNTFASVCRSEGAQPALFLKVLNNGLGKCELSMLSLTGQERSGSAIVEWINRRFDDQIDAVIADSAMPFLAAQPQKDTPGNVELHAVAGSLDAESRLVAKLLKDQPDLLDGTVAVLLGDGAGAASIIDTLRAAGIRCSSDAVDLLGQRSVISDLHALTRALCHLSDRVAWLTVLRAPWCGLTLKDLHRLSADSSQVAVWDLVIDERRRSQLSEDGQQRLSRIKRVVAQTLAERGRRDLRRLVEGVWTALGGSVAVRTQFELAQTRDYFRMLEQIDDGGEPDSLEALDAAVARLCAETGVEDQESVLVTTIRNARRRVFDTVIVAGVSTGIPLPDDDDAMRWLVRPDQFGSAQLLLAPVSGEGRGDAINQWVKSLQTRMHENELKRLFYAGLTPANEHLHIIVRPPHGVDGWGLPPVHSLLHAMWHEIADLLPAAPEISVDPSVGGDPAPDTIRRLPSSWLLPEAPQPKDWYARETQARPSSNSLAAQGDDARIIARVMKRTLSEISARGPVDWAMRSLEGLENSFQQLFAMMGISEKRVPGAADRAGLAIRSTLEDRRAQWLLSSAHKKSRSPLQLTGWLDDSLIDAEIDRSFVDDNGFRWIVGYCFPELDSGADESAPDLVAGAQRSTWNDFARLARRYDPNPVRIGLYFPYSTAWREWDPEA